MDCEIGGGRSEKEEKARVKTLACKVENGSRGKEEEQIVEKFSASLRSPERKSGKLLYPTSPPFILVPVSVLPCF